MGLGISIAGVQSLCGEIQCLILKYRLSLYVTNRAANGEHEDEKPGGDNVANRKWLGLQQEIKNSASKAQGEGCGGRRESDVV